MDHAELGRHPFEVGESTVSHTNEHHSEVGLVGAAEQGAGVPRDEEVHDERRRRKPHPLAERGIQHEQRLGIARVVDLEEALESH